MAKGSKKMAPNANTKGGMAKLPTGSAGTTKGVGAPKKGNLNKPAKGLQKNTVGKKTNGVIKPSKNNSQKTK